MADGDLGRQDSRAAATRHALMSAAQKAFAEHGFEGASTHGIAAEAGLPQGLIRHHFGGKEGLARAVLERGLARLGAALDAGAGREPLTVASWVRCLPEHAELLRMLAHVLLAPGPLRACALQHAQPLWQRLRALHQRGQGAQSNDEQLAMWVAASLALPVFGAAIAPDAEPHALRQRNTLHAWLTTSIAAAPSGPYSLGAARSRLRG